MAGNDNRNIAEKLGTNDGLSSKVTSSTNACPIDITKSFSTKKVGSKESVKIAGGLYDKRISLTCAPKTFSRDESLFIDKVKYVLGSKYSTSKDLNWLLSGSKFYGLLYNALSSSSGLIFPYTPAITFGHKVNYETSEITHSNISYNYYRNTPCPTINISNAHFTADNRVNALHMLSAIWFLTACTKCEFGEANPASSLAVPSEKGLPPPVLYLNGYNSTIDNIPVVISGVSYDYPADKHYVNLVLDMSKPGDDSNFCKIYDNKVTETYNSTENLDKNFVGPPEVRKSTVTKNGINLSFWLPTELTMSINLLVQPNFIKTRKQWNLDNYKTGLMMTNNGKNPTMVYDNQLETTKEGCLKKVNKTYSSIPSGWTW